MLKIVNTIELALSQGSVPLPEGTEIFLFLDIYNSSKTDTGVNLLTNVKNAAGEIVPTYPIDQFPKDTMYISGDEEISKEGKKGVGTREDSIYEGSLVARQALETLVPATSGEFEIVGLNLEPIV